MCMAAALPMAGGYLLGRREQKEEPTITQNFSGIEGETPESTEEVTAATRGSSGSSQSSRTTEKAY